LIQPLLLYDRLKDSLEEVQALATLFPFELLIYLKAYLVIRQNQLLHSRQILKLVAYF